MSRQNVQYNLFLNSCHDLGILYIFITEASICINRHLYKHLTKNLVVWSPSKLIKNHFNFTVMSFYISKNRYNTSWT